MGISAVVRWNINGNTAHVLDTIIRPDKRSFKFLKGLIRYGMNKANVKRITWERENKYPGRKQKQLGV